MDPDYSKQAIYYLNNEFKLVEIELTKREFIAVVKEFSLNIVGAGFEQGDLFKRHIKPKLVSLKNESDREQQRGGQEEGQETRDGETRGRVQDGTTPLAFGMMLLCLLKKG